MLGIGGIKTAILKAIEQGLIGYVPAMTITSSIPIPKNNFHTPVLIYILKSMLKSSFSGSVPMF